MNDIVILKNQIIIMKALMEIPNVYKDTLKELKEQIVFTEARIRALS